MELTIDNLIAFNDALLTKDNLWVKNEFRRAFPEFSDIEYYINDKTITIYAIDENKDSGNTCVEAIRYDYQADKYYIRDYGNDKFKYLMETASARREEIIRFIKLYLTICRIKGVEL